MRRLLQSHARAAPIFGYEVYPGGLEGAPNRDHGRSPGRTYAILESG